MRVLLVEEDLQIGESLLRALKVADCSVDWVRDGKAGSVAINTAYYAVVLLDPGLSGAGGIDLLRALRAAGNDVPVLILTALDDLETRVHSLDVGATIAYSSRSKSANFLRASGRYCGARRATRPRVSAASRSASISTNACCAATGWRIPSNERSRGHFANCVCCDCR
jgi:DNA-binding response OmpR family regulator